MVEHSPPGRYRVRPADRHESSVPLHVQAPRFHCREDADSYALLLMDQCCQSVVVEKLAPGGCWLQLTRLG